MLFDWTTLVLFLLVLLFTAWFLQRPGNLPPGPPSWPIIGHIWSAVGNTEWHLQIQEYWHRYGNVFTLRYGQHPVIVLNGHKLIHRALVENADEFSERPYWLPNVQLSKASKGIIWNKAWKGQRKLTLTALKDFGLGKASLEDKVREETQACIQAFESKQGKPFNCQILMSTMISNIICSVVFGKRFDYDNKEFEDIMKHWCVAFQNNPNISIPNFVPIVTLIQRFVPRHKEFMQTRNAINNFIMKRIEDHKATFDPDNIRDYVDLCLREMQTGGLDEDGMVRTIFDLFAAGTETTSTTLQWLFIYMMYHPEIHHKCTQEIHDEIGTSRLPTMKDRGTMLYTEATLLEVQRVATIVPLSLPHMTTKAIEMEGYTLPKGIMVIPHIFSSHLDPDYWGDPETFRPDRWIGEDGKLMKHKAFIPFSVGRRSCLGEQLAKMEIFLFGVAFLQRFEFKMADPKPNLTGDLGVTLVPKPFEMIAKPL